MNRNLFGTAYAGFLSDRTLKDIHVRLFLMLQCHCGGKTECKVKVSTLAKEIHRKATQVRAALKHLEREGYIAILPDPGRASRYIILFKMKEE